MSPGFIFIFTGKLAYRLTHDKILVRQDMKFPQIIDFFCTTHQEKTISDISEQIISAYNDERALRNIARLRPNTKLAKAAYNYVIWLNNHGNLESADLSSLVLETGYKPRMIGENVAKGYTSVSSAMSAWMVSSQHRRNILQPSYTDIGSVVIDEYWCAVFADQSPTCDDIIIYNTGGPVHAPLCG